MKTLVAAAVAALLAATGAQAGPKVLVPRSQMGTMDIPRLHLVTPMYEGSTMMYQGGVNWPPELNSGPAHYPGTAYPWQPGTVAFAGHRVTHTHPFRWLNMLRKGDKIVLRTRWGAFTYRVQAVDVVSPDATWVLGWGGKRSHRLVLTACNPPHFSSTRIVAFAKRVSVRRA